MHGATFSFTTTLEQTWPDFNNTFTVALGDKLRKKLQHSKPLNICGKAVWPRTFKVTDLRRGGRKTYSSVFRSLSVSVEVKESLKSVNIAEKNIVRITIILAGVTALSRDTVLQIDIIILQGSAELCLKCDEIFSYHCIAKRYVILKSVNFENRSVFAIVMTEPY